MVFNLANPYIEGNTNMSSDKKTPSAAAEHLWSMLSQNIKNFTPKFYFSIQDGGSKKVYHYRVTEAEESGEVVYKISNYNTNKKEIDRVLLNELNNNSQNGGKYKKSKNDSSSSSSSSSSSDDYYDKIRRRQQLLSLTYYPTIYGVRNIFLPTFTSTFTPYVNIGFPIYNTPIYIHP